MVRRAGALLSLAAIYSVVAGAGGAPADLHGVARAGARPAPDTVIWLEAPTVRPSTSCLPTSSCPG